MSNLDVEFGNWNTAVVRQSIINAPVWAKDFTFATYPGTVPLGIGDWLAGLKYDGPRGLILYGASGRGKTGLGISALKEMAAEAPGDLFLWNIITHPKYFAALERNDGSVDLHVPPVSFIQWDRALSKYRRERFDEEGWFEQLDTEASVLMLDDISAEKVSAYKESFLLRHIEWPFERKKRALILTMNTPPSNWASVFGDRITSRLLDPRWFTVLEIKGDDFRG